MRRLAIYHPAGRAALGENVFGKDVANFQLFQAILRHGGLNQADFLTHAPVTSEDLVRGLLGDEPCPAKVTASSILNQRVAVEAGALLRGAAKLEDVAWLRRKTAGDHAYSLMGLVHTIAPPLIRQEIAACSIAPIHPWDAVICTSPAVQDALTTMFDEWEDFLGDRYGGSKKIRPQLPLIPLGVDGVGLGASADRPDVRARTRKALGVGEDEILLIWVGRLSFFEKAFPQSMMRAAEEAAQATGKRVHFAMIGWFPDGANGEPRYRQAAGAHAPSVVFHIIDGNDRAHLADLWASADIFTSLVDNIQETFGITPLEAMASGLPVVVSDWDGYRYTVRDGQEGFLIPTLGGSPDGLPGDLVSEHAFGLKTYQQYVGIVAQHTAVHIGRAADAIKQLILSPELRRQMGEAGRRRIRETFDWSVVAPQYAALAEELKAIRIASAPPNQTSRLHPVRGEPFRDFAGFATSVLTPELRVRPRPGAGLQDLGRMQGVELDMFAANWRCTLAECGVLLQRLAQLGEASVAELITVLPPGRQSHAQAALVWMAKQGLIDWLTPE